MTLLHLLAWCGAIVLVIWFTLIGIFAIEEINAREAAATLLSTKNAEVLTRLARDCGSPLLEREQARLSELQTRLAILTMDGSESLGERGTLKAILRELDGIDDVPPGANSASPAPDSVSDVPPMANSASDVASPLSKPESSFIKHVPLGTKSSTGTILAGLIVTAAFGGAFIRRSVDAKQEGASREHVVLDVLRTLLRALGGGIVCYFVVVGGGIPLAAVDIAKSASPATASLFGLISGMFSNSVFKLVSDFVDAFVRKVTPDSSKDTGKEP